ncbi:MAG: hypothetical protein NT126_03940 [Bacteroidetes bacterium]|nr:hypothetical protein [Bacteroidota bacterium]
MAFDAKVFRVLVASPVDVGEERNVIPEIVNEWNAVNAFGAKVIIMPVKWETHSAPLLGGRPQEIINEQLVKDCDLLVGVFWTRIGTNTGISVSGTAEEIEQFVELKKPVMLYFSQSPIDPDRIEIDQFTILKNFKEKMRLKGLTETYANIHDFRQKFTRQFSINIGNILSPPSPITKAESPKTTTTKVGKKSHLTAKPIVINPIGTAHEKLTPEKVDEYLIKTVQAVSNHDGWAGIAAVGHYLQTFTPVNYHDFGFPKLKGFLKSRKLFEFKDVKEHPMLKALPTVTKS